MKNACGCDFSATLSFCAMDLGDKKKTLGPNSSSFFKSVSLDCRQQSMKRKTLESVAMDARHFVFDLFSLVYDQRKISRLESIFNETLRGESTRRVVINYRIRSSIYRKKLFFNLSHVNFSIFPSQN